jgi:translation initiation factor IF-2
VDKDAGKQTKVTEERVTRKVIRRRASVETPVVESAPPVVEAAPEVVETPIEVAPEPVVVQEAAPVAPEPEPVVEKAPEVQKPKEPVSPYANTFQKLKVLNKTEIEPRLQVKAPAAPGYQPDNRPSFGGPGNPTLTRKEIIDIRDSHGKGGKKRKMPHGRVPQKTQITQRKAEKRVIKMGEMISVQEFAKKMSVKANEVIQKLMRLGMIATINQTIDVDTATLVASEFEYEVEKVSIGAEDILQAQITEEAAKEDAGDIQVRPPVVTIMGHVDHGKTSLLDIIRKANVAAGEAGGITQHIGAYSITTESGRQITFIDTPGHESFTAMRARGAKVTDIVIIVVAADDGVMPQTREAISHAKSAGVPIIVALNKMDKPGVNPEKVKKELTEFELVAEEWGGDTHYAPVSAKTGMGVSDLLESILVQAEVMELKANPKKFAKGIVIESRLDKGRGAVMTLLVQDGTLKIGDNIVAGSDFGRVRDMRDDRGMRLKEAGPALAVEITGLSGVSSAGDEVSVVSDEKKAKQIAEMRKNIEREKELAQSSKVSLDALYEKIEEGDVKELKIIVKADTDGSVEVLKDSIQKLSTSKVAVKVIHGAVGGITENDVMLAAASKAIIIGFNVRPQADGRKLAEQKQVEIRLYKIIYELADELKKAMAGLLAPNKVEKIIGRIEVREVYNIPKIGTIAGCYVNDGRVTRSSKVRLIRDDVEVYMGQLASLKRFKDDAREVKAGMECGLSIQNFNDIKVGDIIEPFEIEEVAATI